MGSMAYAGACKVGGHHTASHHIRRLCDTACSRLGGQPKSAQGLGFGGFGISSNDIFRLMSTLAADGVTSQCRCQCAPAMALCWGGTATALRCACHACKADDGCLQQQDVAHYMRPQLSVNSGFRGSGFKCDPLLGFMKPIYQHAALACRDPGFRVTHPRV